jgi:hypothetical protein
MPMHPYKCQNEACGIVDSMFNHFPTNPLYEPLPETLPCPVCGSEMKNNPYAADPKFGGPIFSGLPTVRLIRPKGCSDRGDGRLPKAKYA